MSVIKPKVSRFQILLINFTYKLQLQLLNLIYVQNCIIFGLDEFLYINFQILSRNREKSKLRFFWDSLKEPCSSALLFCLAQPMKTITKPQMECNAITLSAKR